MNDVLALKNKFADQIALVDEYNQLSQRVAPHHPKIAWRLTKNGSFFAHDVDTPHIEFTTLKYWVNQYRQWAKKAEEEALEVQREMKLVELALSVMSKEDLQWLLNRVNDDLEVCIEPDNSLAYRPL